MKKLASYNYDILDHILSGDLEKVATVIKSLSKNAQVADIPGFDEQEAREASDFALIIRHPFQGDIKKYAKYTPELTEINMALLEDSMDELPEEIIKTAGQNLTAAAREYNLDIPEKLASRNFEDNYVDNEISLSTVNEYDYAIKLSEAMKPKYALPDKLRYPINDSVEIKQAAEYFDKYAHQFDPAEAIEFARNVKHASTEYKVDLNDSTIEKFAGLNTDEYNEDFEFHVKSRKRYLKEEDQPLYDDLVKIASEHTPAKVAMAVERADKKLGLDQHWGTGIANPALATFKPLQKVAAGQVTLEQLRGMDKTALTTLVGTEAVDDLMGDEGVEVFNTLPRPIKKEVISLL